MSLLKFTQDLQYYVIKNYVLFDLDNIFAKFFQLGESYETLITRYHWLEKNIVTLILFW